MNLLLIGGSGFIGKSIIDSFSRGLLKTSKIKKIIVLSRNPKILKKLPINLKNISYIKSSIGKVKTLPKCNYIIYLSEDSSGKKLNLNKQKQHKINIKNCLSIVRRMKNIKFLYCSSGSVNDYKKRKKFFSNYKEKYAEMKIFTEKEVQALSRFKIKSSIARCYTFIGPWLALNKHYAIGNFLSDALKKKFITVKSNHNVIRSYMYADDMVFWLIKILQNSKINCPIYNVGSDYKVSLNKVAEIIGRILNKPVKTLFLNNKKTDKYVPNIKKTEKDLKLKINYNLLESIILTINRINEKTN